MDEMNIRRSRRERARRRRNIKRARALVLTAAVIITLAAIAALVLPDVIERHRWNRSRQEYMELYNDGATD